MLNLEQYFPITDPTLIFFVVLLIILSAPIIMGKLRIPHIIGMVLAGVFVGKYGFNLLERDASFELFGKVGLYYIIFLASLEMDMEGLRTNLRRIWQFGLLTFIIPFLLTYLTAITLLSYSHELSFLLSALMASNTLIAYPIVGRYGLQRKPSVMLSVGGSMIALLLALTCLAALVAAHDGHQSGTLFWIWFFSKFVLLVALLLLIIPRITRWFLRRYSDAVMQFIFVLSMLFLSAALSEAAGLEGIIGAFLSGLILNRYIPHVSPLMNRIEFIGNALFIPYFLIGVGMLINVRLLFEGGNIFWIMLAMVFFGTVGKAIAAYAASFLFRLPLSSGHMMFGLTSAHAAGAIAIVMVGMNIEMDPGVYLVGDDILNGIIMMILFTCIISTIVTDKAAQQIIIRDKEIANEDEGQEEERMLIPVKYPEYAYELLNFAILLHKPRKTRSLVALNVVYDDTNVRQNQEKGKELLDNLTQHAAAADVTIDTQVRIAANIANGIKHAFKEFRASEIIIGMHMHREVSTKFWGSFHQSLFNGLNRQIIMARLKQPLNTIRRIQVAVPSRAQFEPGFYRWLERLARLAGNLECRILFHGRGDTLSFINEYIRNRHHNVRAEYADMPHGNQFPRLAATIAEDHLFVVITARKGTVSYKDAMDRLPEEITRFFSGTSMMIIFPDQFGSDKMDEMTFAQPQHTEELSAYEFVRHWFHKKFHHS